MKRKLSLILAISLTLILSLSAMTFASEDKVAQSEVDQARDAGQAWLDGIAKLPSPPSQWIGARVITPQTYYDLLGEPNAYMFAIAKDSKIVGHILVGSSSYGYPVFEAGEAAPPSIPTADKVKSIVEKDLGLIADKQNFSKPVRLLYLGIDEFYAVYEVGNEMVGINLIFEHATLASNLKAYMRSPQEYKAAKKEIGESKPRSLKVNCSQGFCWVTLPMSYYSEGGRVYCGPCSGVSIGRYYRDELGYDDLPSPDWNMYDWLWYGMDAGSYNGAVMPWKYGPGFIWMTENCPGHYDNFSYDTNYGLESQDYWTVVEDLDNGWPLGLEVTDEWHWRAIRGCYWRFGDFYLVQCTNSQTHENLEYLDWNSLDLPDFTCCIKDS